MNDHVMGEAKVFGNARVSGSARVSDDAKVSGNAKVSENAKVFGSAWVSENAQVSGNAWVSENAQVFGNARVSGSAWVSYGAEVFEPGHVICLTGPFQGSVTVYRTADGHRVQAGCQNLLLTDDLEELALVHEWDLPAGWESIRDGLLSLVATWHTDAP